MTPTDADDPLRTTDAPPDAIAPHAALPADQDVTATRPAGREVTAQGGRIADSAAFPTVPGYQIEGVLGRGAMGVVYKARHLALKRTVALKMVLAGGHAGPRELARFRTEAEAVARLQHPNIVQIHEVGEAGGHPYCALEFVEGGTLAGRLAGKPLPPREAALLLEALARAMQLAHSRNVVHRDLKPANVLLAGDCTPKITDFGLARQLDGDSGDTQAGAVLGTPSYMAPEQASGRAHEAGPAADVYALGAILYDCLTGRPPFKGATVVETLDLVRTREPVPPSRVKEGVPFDLETICLKAMAKDPARRYPTAGEMAADLRRFLDDEPILARPVGVGERLWRRVRRNPALAGLCVAILALGAVIGVVATRPRLEPAAPPEVDTSAEELLGVVAELDRADPDWRLEQIEARRPDIPDDQNGALQVLAFRDAVSDLRGVPRSRSSSARWQSEGLQERLAALDSLSPTARLTGADVADFRAELKRVERALTQARILADYPRGRFPIAHRRDAVSTLLPHYGHAKQLVGLLYLDALVHDHDGDRPAAVRDCLAMANAGNAIRDEPFVISQAVRMSLFRSVVRAVERLAARGACTDGELATLQKMLADAATDPVLIIGARGGRAHLHNAFSALEAGDLQMAEFLRMLVENDHPQPPGAREVRLLHAWVLRYHTKVVEIAKLPTEQRPALLAALDSEIKAADLPVADPSFRSLPQSYVPVAQAHNAHLARLRCTLTALAAERYRLARGEWPRDLAALVPEYLKEVPQDPYDGRPLRYRRTAGGAVVYGVGEDRTDDQGKLNRTPKPVEGTDTGFQLWNLEHRR